MNLDGFVEYTGYVIIITGSLLLMVFFIFLAAYFVYILSGHIQYYLVDSIGGWKTFLEYRDWYHKNKSG